MRLSLKSRTGIDEQIPLSSADTYFLTSMAQPRLSELHRKFDIICHCQQNSVVMHIRHRTDTNLYFIADNPSSERHTDNCEFYSLRKQSEHSEPVDILLLPLNSFHPYQNANASLSKSVTRKKPSPHSLPTIVKLFSTLCENSYANYSFGRFQSFKGFITKIIDCEKNTKIMTPWGKPITDCIHYGPQGLLIAQKAVKTYSDCQSQIPTAIWFGYLPDIEIMPGSLIYKDQNITYEHLHQPHKANGPFVLCGFIPKPADDSTPVIRDLLVIPIVASNHFLPIHTNQQREFALKYFPILFGKNLQKDVKHFIKKPLLPLIEAGFLIYTDWLLTEKSKIGNFKRTKTFVVEHADRHHLMSEIYDTEVLTPSELIKSN